MKIFLNFAPTIGVSDAIPIIVVSIAMIVPIKQWEKVTTYHEKSAFLLEEKRERKAGFKSSSSSLFGFSSSSFNIAGTTMTSSAAFTTAHDFNNYVVKTTICLLSLFQKCWTSPPGRERERVPVLLSYSLNFDAVWVEFQCLMASYSAGGHPFLSSCFCFPRCHCFHSAGLLQSSVSGVEGDWGGFREGLVKSLP